MNHFYGRWLGGDHLVRGRGSAKGWRNVASPNRSDDPCCRQSGRRGPSDRVGCSDAPQGQRQLAQFGGDVDSFSLFRRHFQCYSSAETIAGCGGFRVGCIDCQHTQVLNYSLADRAARQRWVIFKRLCQDDVGVGRRDTKCRCWPRPLRPGSQSLAHRERARSGESRDRPAWQWRHG
jgi:hypothetical protein